MTYKNFIETFLLHLPSTEKHSKIFKITVTKMNFLMKTLLFTATII